MHCFHPPSVIEYVDASVIEVVVQVILASGMAHGQRGWHGSGLTSGSDCQGHAE